MTVIPISYMYACGKLTGTFTVLGVLSSNTPTLNYTLSIIPSTLTSLVKVVWSLIRSDAHYIRSIAGAMWP